MKSNPYIHLQATYYGHYYINMSNEFKYAVSLVIYRDPSNSSGKPTGASEVVVVQRPSTDKDLPNAWGLPAGMVTFDPTTTATPTPDDFSKSAIIAGKAKMGLDVEIVRDMGTQSRDRGAYTLTMTQFEVRIIGKDGAVDSSALPVVPQPVEGITQYQQWRWGVAEELLPAAIVGSVCSRIYLKHATGYVPPNP